MPSEGIGLNPASQIGGPLRVRYFLYVASTAPVENR